jgi:hypothetical protein
MLTFTITFAAIFTIAGMGIGFFLLGAMAAEWVGGRQDE